MFGGFRGLHGILPGLQASRYRTSFSTARNQLLESRKKAEAARRKGTLSSALYASSAVLLFVTLSFASVPLYRALCSRTGFGGTPVTDSSKFTAEKLVPVQRMKRIRVQFSSTVSNMIPWKLVPQQREVQVLPGETALAFYRAKNLSKESVTGMATYSIVPERAAQYFSKIQCFCFEEQQLRPGEEVDMPVFFFIDPDFVKDPTMANVDEIVLHYTFFKAQYDANGNFDPQPLADTPGAPVHNS